MEGFHYTTQGQKVTDVKVSAFSECFLLITSVCLSVRLSVNKMPIETPIDYESIMNLYEVVCKPLEECLV